MRSVIAALALLLSVAAAQAQSYKVAASGQQLLLYQAASANPDCTSTGNVVVRVAAQPEHGRVSVVRSGVFPTFSMTNPRHHCNSRRVPGVKVFYTSRRGYTGPDAAALEVIFPAGAYARRSFGISVR